MKKINVLSSLNLSKRLDIVVKLLFIESQETWIHAAYFERLYIKHIWLWTGFIEDEKKSQEDFLIAFKNLIESFKTHGFKKEISDILIGKNNSPLSGAHRIACALYFGIDISFQIVQEESWISWDISWFIKNQFSRDEILCILWKYKEITGESIIILWPTCENKKLLHETLRYRVSAKEFSLYENILDIYSFDRYNIKDIWIENKAHIMAQHEYFDIVFLRENIEKDILRHTLIPNITNTSIPKEEQKFFTFHSADTQEEDIYICNILFSPIYWQHLELRQNKIWKSFQKLIKSLPSMYTRDMCIAWSGSLWVYDITPVSDIDLITKHPSNNGIQKIDKNIDILDYEYYPEISNSNIIEHYFFYWRWYKCISLFLLQEIKSIWLREKDGIQAELIKNFLKNHDIHTPKVEWSFTQKYKHFQTRMFVQIVRSWIFTTKKLWIYEKCSYYWRKYILSKFR